MRLNHIHLTSSEPQKTSEFYQKYFGFKRVRQIQKTTVMTNADQFILAFDGVEISQAVRKPCHIGFTLTEKGEVELLYQRMQRDGISAGDLQSPNDNVIHFYCEDPCGNSIEVGWYRF